MLWRAGFWLSHWSTPRKVLSAILAVFGTVIITILLWPRAPENADGFVPVSASRIQLLSRIGDNPFREMYGYPTAIMSPNSPDSFYLKRVFDGFYNELDVRCKVRVLSGLSARSSMEDYRILVESSQAKLLLHLHAPGEMIVSDDFVCVGDPGIPALPGVKQIRVTATDQLKTTLVIDGAKVERLHVAASLSPGH